MSAHALVAFWWPLALGLAVLWPLVALFTAAPLAVTVLGTLVVPRLSREQITAAEALHTRQREARQADRTAGLGAALVRSGAEAGYPVPAPTAAVMLAADAAQGYPSTVAARLADDDGPRLIVVNGTPLRVVSAQLSAAVPRVTGGRPGLPVALVTVSVRTIPDEDAEAYVFVVRADAPVTLGPACPDCPSGVGEECRFDCVSLPLPA